MKVVIWSILMLIGHGCTETKEKNTREKINDAHLFLKSKEYVYSTDKEDIPKEVLESLSIEYAEEFKIGDSSEVGRINLTDLRLYNSEGEKVYEFNRAMHFILLGDSTYLLSYTQGGVGIHDVVVYLKYGRNCAYEKYTTTENLNDLDKLEMFLQGNPKPSVNSRL